MTTHSPELASEFGAPREPQAPLDGARRDPVELIESPYRLVYRVRPDAIEMLAILHERQSLDALP